jgi:GTP-binding protein EngB required for normal cell division
MSQNEGSHKGAYVTSGGDSDDQRRWANIHSRQVAQSQPLPLKKKRKYTIIVIGCSGRGKSTFCNFLFREERFKTQVGGWGNAMSVKSEAQFGVIEDRATGVELSVVDIPGYLATHLRTDDDEDLFADGEMVLEEFSNALMQVKDGIDAIFVTLRAGERVAKEEQLLMKFLDELRLWKHCVLLFTHGHRVGKDENERYDEFYKSIRSKTFQDNCPVLVKMYGKANNRFLIVESLNHKGDEKYYNSKLDEICKAVDVVHEKAGTAIDHPMLELARNSQQMYRQSEAIKMKHREEKLKDEETIQSLRSQLQAKQGEVAEARAIVQSMNEEKEKLVSCIEEDEYLSLVPEGDRRRQASHHLVNYLKQLTDDPHDFVDAYTQLERMVSEQRNAMARESHQQPANDHSISMRRVEENVDHDGEEVNIGTPAANDPPRRKRKCTIL